MNWKTIRAITAAALMGIIAGAATALFSSGAADAAPALRVENKALVDAVQGAQSAFKAGRFAEALAKAKEADAIQGKPAELTRQIHQMVVAYAISAKDYNSAFVMLDRMIAANEGDKSKRYGTE